MQGYRRNCSACHSFCCPISHENCISVMLANSVNRSAHGMVILYSMVHLSCNCFIILLAAPFHYLAIEWPPGILVHTNFVFVIGEQGTREVRRKGIRAVYISEYMEKSWHTSLGCRSAYAWQCWTLPEVSCTEHTHIHAVSTIHTQCLTHRISCGHYSTRWLSLIDPWIESSVRSRYP